MIQQLLFDAADAPNPVRPFKKQLLKWIGNKQRFAHEIASFFPKEFKTYYEPFIGSGAVMATLAPERGVGSDAFLPLIEIWQELVRSPEALKSWYADRWHAFKAGDSEKARISLIATYDFNIGTFRNNIFQSPNRYTTGAVDINVSNLGGTLSRDLRFQLEVPDTCVIAGFGGCADIEIQEADSTWIAMGKYKGDWPE
jgi:hypothetical protein